MKPLIDRKTVKHMDLTLLIIVFFILLYGILGLYSATHLPQGVVYKTVFNRQLLWLGIGFLGMFLAAFFNYTTISRYAYVIYAISIILLILVLIIGKYVQGSRRWIVLGFLTFQPSEFAKIGIILTLSKLLSSKADYHSKALSYKISLLGILIIMIPAVLILIEPDLGSAVVTVFIGFSILILNRMKLRIVMLIFLLAAISSPLLWNHMKDYQKARVRAFLDPNLDPTGAGYHINQSKIAIGSGQITGKGFMKGTQTRLHYLPEHYTDFIFSHIAEEYGFVGSVVLIGLYLLLIVRCTHIALKSKDTLGYNLSISTAILFFWHAIVNLGMVTGLLPVVGVPLIFVSYGGSSILTGMVSIGLSLNVSMRRFLYR